MNTRLGFTRPWQRMHQSSAHRQSARRQHAQPARARPGAPHAFTNAGDAPSRLLCLCAPAGQEEFFTLAGQPVATRTEAPPPLGAGARAAPSSPGRGRSRPSTRPSCLRRPARNKGTAAEMTFTLDARIPRAGAKLPKASQGGGADPVG
jgi:hypothetical protein